MQEINLKLTQATEQDIAQIALLAAKIWNQHYIPIIGKDQVDYMLNRMYSAESLKEQMTDRKDLFFLINLNLVVTGFVSVHEEKKDEWLLNKFYIQQSDAGKGIGTRVLSELEQVLKPKKITLTVNRQNHKSINFYFKNGFTIERVADFDIGNGYVMNDFVMEKNVPGS